VPKVFVALDVDDPASALKLARTLSRPGVGFKLGPRLLLRADPGFISDMSQLGPVFWDPKYFDIPNTMEASIRASFDLGADFVTIHGLSGPEALKRLATVEAELSSRRPFRLLVVTVLTSFSSDTLPHPLRGRSVTDLVSELAREATAAGLTGFVCSPQEVSLLRSLVPNGYLVTPGVRPAGASATGFPDDQVRVATPRSAFSAGASALVIGRPILEAKDPEAILDQVIAESDES
jgi:orotidine-5'-phosphate decarboxylase